MSREQLQEGPQISGLHRQDVNRRQLLAGMAGLVGVGALGAGLGGWAPVAAALTAPLDGDETSTGPRRSGLLIHIQSVDVAKGVTLAGVVQPAAQPLWFQVKHGVWHHRTTSGDGVLEIDGERIRVSQGQTLTIPAGRRIRYINEGNKSWAFEAQHPLWSTATMACGMGARSADFEQLRFAFRRSPRHSSSATYRLANPHLAGKQPRLQGLLRADGLAIEQHASHEGVGFDDPLTGIRSPAERTPAAILWGLQRPQAASTVPGWFELVV